MLAYAEATVSLLDHLHLLMFSRSADDVAHMLQLYTTMYGDASASTLGAT